MELLKELCMVDGISGYEDNVAKVMERELSKTCESVERDSFGNVIGKFGNGKTKIMIATHMDEIGLMVKNINEKGFISFVKIGGIDDRMLLSKTVIIKTKKGDVQGIIGSKPPHLQKKEEVDKVIKHDELFIDIGAKSKDEAEKKVAVGDAVIFDSKFGKFDNGMVYAKAIDNRIGCYAMLKIMEQLPKKINATIYAVGTCQEEVGLKGARVAAFKLNPDYAFAIDTTIAGDTPQIRENESILKLGEGPAITLAEASGRGLISHPELRELLINTAKKHKIPYQIDVVEGGMTDGAIIYLTREGIPTGTLSIPCRYIHTPVGVFNMKDLDNTIKLVSAALKDRFPAKK